MAINARKIRQISQDYDKIQSLISNKSDRDLLPVPDRFTDFCKLLEVRSGSKIVPLELYDYQRKVIDCYDRGSTAVTKGRQCGLSTITLAYLLWNMARNPAYTCLCISMTSTDASILGYRMRDMVLQLEQYIKPATDSLLHIRLDGGGMVYFRSGRGADAARGIDSVNAAFVDEAASIEGLTDTINSIAPCMSFLGSDARFFLVTTPKGKSNDYYEKLVGICPDTLDICEDIRSDRVNPYQEYYDPQSKWFCAFIGWRAVPLFADNPNFLKDKSLSLQMPLSAVEREYNLAFEDTENTVFSSDMVLKFTDVEIEPEKQGDGEMYCFGIDTATGVGGDYFVCTIMKAIYSDRLPNPQFHLVAAYRSNQNSLQGYIFEVVNLMKAFKPVQVAYESNGGGKLIADELALNYNDPIYIKVSTTRDSKETMIANIKYLIESDTIKAPREPRFGKQLVKEMLQYQIDEDGRMGGKHTDDMVMSLAVNCEGISQNLLGRDLAIRKSINL